MQWISGQITLATLIEQVMAQTKSFFTVLALIALCGCSIYTDISETGVAQSNRVVPTSELYWEALNPARGAMSPRAATLWGDRTGGEATGFIAKFEDGFSSPPHIHNVSYRAVVIEGAIHNDDPLSPAMWMKKGSFWTQPAGDVHITAARGDNNLALVEIDRGPYLVDAPSAAFTSDERPVNIDVLNIVWIEASEFTGSDTEAGVAYLWGDFREGSWNGSFLKIPAGFSGRIRNLGTILHAVVVKGYVNYRKSVLVRLDPGSYFGSDQVSEHTFSSVPDGYTILYIRTNGSYELTAD